MKRKNTVRKSDIWKRTYTYTIDRKDWDDFWKQESGNWVWPEKLLPYFTKKAKKVK